MISWYMCITYYLFRLRIRFFNKVLEGHRGPTVVIYFTPFASSPFPSTIFLCKPLPTPLTGVLLFNKVLEGHRDCIASIAYNSQRNAFVTSDHHTLKMWSLQTGLIRSIPLPK
jgi:hypothetical protein